MSKDGPGPQRKPVWKEGCANKREKKQVLSDELNSAGERVGDRSCQSRGSDSGSSACRLESLTECFSDVQDPRLNRRRRHLLIDIIVIAVLAVIANADTWSDIHIWGETHQEWLGSFLALPNGIPSRDTFRRTISRINPQAFQNAFLRWLSGLRRGLQGIIAIDGKTLRGSRLGEENPLHIVSAWATEQHLTLGQQQVDGKSNEITAIPKLLEMLELKGAIVTIDAMGCQKDIAAAIIKGKGNYCLAVKGNQETLEADVRASFAAAFENEFESAGQQQHFTAEEKRRHGRVESRSYYTLPVTDQLRTREDWAGLKSIGMTTTYRSVGRTEADEGEIRYYIMSFESNVEEFARAARGHWGIENSLHWVMDVTFREDESRIRKDHGGENVSWLRRLAITLLKNDTTRKGSIRAKRIRAGYDRSYLEEIINGIPIEN